MAYPYFLTTGAHMSDEVIYSVVKTMNANKDFLRKANGRFGLFDPNGMRAKSPVPYHPGAAKFYKEKGMM